MAGEDFEAVSEAKKQKVATYASELKKPYLSLAVFLFRSYRVLSFAMTALLNFKLKDRSDEMTMAKLFLTIITPRSNVFC